MTRRKDRCPKCGSSKIETKYAPNCWCAHGLDKIEHLLKTCICGYVWQEPTRDATAKEGEVVP
jgi:hypothetical protein